MLERGKMDRGVIEIVDTESLVPKDHLLRKIDEAVDFNRLYEMVEPLYSEDNGRPSVDPVVLFKMVLIQHLYGLPSLRRTADEISANICYRWFLGYTLQEETPHFSTVSYNFRHRIPQRLCPLRRRGRTKVLRRCHLLCEEQQRLGFPLIYNIDHNCEMSIQ